MLIKLTDSLLSLLFDHGHGQVRELTVLLMLSG